MNDSLSSLRGFMKENLSEKELTDLVDEITVSTLTLESASNDHKRNMDFQISEVTTKSELAVVYGRLLIEFSNLLKMFSLKSLHQITKSDYNSLMGSNISGTTHDFSLNYDREILENMKAQIKEIKKFRW